MKTKGAKKRKLAAINQRKRYREHKRLGLCVTCSRKAKTGLVYCLVCQARMRKWWMVRHPLFCLECGKLIKPDERTGRSIHKTCSPKRIAKMYRLTHRRAAITYQDRHRKLGLCTTCPKKAFKGGLCRKHHRMAQERYYERATG